MHSSLKILSRNLFNSESGFESFKNVNEDISFLIFFLEENAFIIGAVFCLGESIHIWKKMST